MSRGIYLFSAGDESVQASALGTPLVDRNLPAFTSTKSYVCLSRVSQSTFSLKRSAIAAMDFFTVPSLTFGTLYCFFVICHDRRCILNCNVTRHPTSTLGCLSKCGRHLLTTLRLNT